MPESDLAKRDLGMIAEEADNLSYYVQGGSFILGRLVFGFQRWAVMYSSGEHSIVWYSLCGSVAFAGLLLKSFLDYYITSVSDWLAHQYSRDDPHPARLTANSFLLFFYAQSISWFFSKLVKWYLLSYKKREMKNKPMSLGESDMLQLHAVDRDLVNVFNRVLHLNLLGEHLLIEPLSGFREEIRRLCFHFLKDHLEMVVKEGKDEYRTYIAITGLHILLQISRLESDHDAGVSKLMDRLNKNIELLVIYSRFPKPRRRVAEVVWVFGNSKPAYEINMLEENGIVVPCSKGSLFVAMLILKMIGLCYGSVDFSILSILEVIRKSMTTISQYNHEKDRKKHNSKNAVAGSFKERHDLFLKGDVTSFCDIVHVIQACYQESVGKDADKVYIEQQKKNCQELKNLIETLCGEELKKICSPKQAARAAEEGGKSAWHSELRSFRIAKNNFPLSDMPLPNPADEFSKTPFNLRHVLLSIMLQLWRYHLLIIYRKLKASEDSQVNEKDDKLKTSSRCVCSLWSSKIKTPRSGSPGEGEEIQPHVPPGSSNDPRGHSMV